MSEFKPATSKTVSGVLRKLADFCDQSKYDDDRKEVASELNIMLDELLNQDFFGTEGQLDPRGDHRD